MNRLHNLNLDFGEEALGWAKDMWPWPRSLTGPGVEQTLDYLKSLLPNLNVHKIQSGTKVFDWNVPDEWIVRDAYIKTPSGEKICQFSECNLHVMGYSTPVDRHIELSELKAHLHSLPLQPDAVPYITSYYKKNWGFCISHNQFQLLEDGKYHVFIDSEHRKGNLLFADLKIKGKSSKEIFFSTYICHPSMANNELSGPVVAASLAQWLQKNEDLKMSYRFVFAPETIGALIYMQYHLPELRSNMHAGFILTCVGDSRGFSFLPSRHGNTPADRVAIRTLDKLGISFKKYSFSDRGSDERQYCSPHADLPVASVMKSKYSEYPEYHTSLDDFSLVTSLGLAESIEFYKMMILEFEKNPRYVTNQIGEPQLGTRGLYPQSSTKDTKSIVKTMMDVLAYSDGQHDIVDLMELTKKSRPEVEELIDVLLKSKVIRICD